MKLLKQNIIKLKEGDVLNLSIEEKNHLNTYLYCYKPKLGTSSRYLFRSNRYVVTLVKRRINTRNLIWKVTNKVPVTL